MRIKLTELRRIVRNVLLEAIDELEFDKEEDQVYPNTAMPDEEADEDILGGPDLSNQDDRDEFLSVQHSKKKQRDRLQSADEIDDAMGDEHAIAGFVAPLGMGAGPGPGPYGKHKKLKPKNAMGRKKKR
tara:strand:- start:1979 stop:2365 length:387 start_codon:yes stop_codon:yes gene_type:complete